MKKEVPFLKTLQVNATQLNPNQTTLLPPNWCVNARKVQLDSTLVDAQIFLFKLPFSLYSLFSKNINYVCFNNRNKENTGISGEELRRCLFLYFVCEERFCVFSAHDSVVDRRRFEGVENRRHCIAAFLTSSVLVANSSHVYMCVRTNVV